jgi:hypothetical protein
MAAIALDVNSPTARMVVAAIVKLRSIMILKNLVRERLGCGRDHATNGDRSYDG